MWGDLFSFDQPCQAVRRTVSAVCGQEHGLYAKAGLRSLKHCSSRPNFGLPDGPRGFDVDDRPVVGVDQIVVGVGEESMPFMRACPLGRRISREMNFGVTGEAAPNAALSNVASYSRVARIAVSLISSGFQSLLGTERCLLASAAMRLASTANPSALTKPSAMHR